MARPATPDRSKYFVPAPSAYPFILTFGLALVVISVWGLLEQKNTTWTVYAGVPVAIAIIYRWFYKVAHESEGGFYGPQVDRTFRWGLSWFIFSEDRKSTRLNSSHEWIS